jgi:hypothetical protein
MPVLAFGCPMPAGHAPTETYVQISPVAQRTLLGVLGGASGILDARHPLMLEELAEREFDAELKRVADAIRVDGRVAVRIL